MRSKTYIERMKKNPRKKKIADPAKPKGPANTPPRKDRSYAGWIKTPTGMVALRRTALHNLAMGPGDKS